MAPSVCSLRIVQPGYHTCLKRHNQDGAIARERGKERKDAMSLRRKTLCFFAPFAVCSCSTVQPPSVDRTCSPPDLHTTQVDIATGVGFQSRPPADGEMGGQITQNQSWAGSGRFTDAISERLQMARTKIASRKKSRATSRNCPVCDSEMQMTRVMRYTEGPSGMLWTCTKNSCLTLVSKNGAKVGSLLDKSA